MTGKTQISNVTNKTDSFSLHSRVFIGNLNTTMVKKSDIELIFSKYGKIIGCSVHKGFAFVQYGSERNARSAVAGENARIVAGQPLGQILSLPSMKLPNTASPTDVNMAGEPRLYRPKVGLKRPLSALYSHSSYGFDYDFYRDDFYGRVLDFHGRVTVPPRVMMPVKRSRLLMPTVRRVKPSQPYRGSSCFSHTRTLTSSSSCSGTKVKSDQLLTIKRELSQIKTKIDSLLGWLGKMERQHLGETAPLRQSDDVYPSLHNETALHSTEEADGEHLERECGEMTDRDEDDYDDEGNVKLVRRYSSHLRAKATLRGSITEIHWS
ncbi:hypothetical protein NFI96_017473 [Prochilodus magdalenae]|nr:hypothetical protein NFI96_017473 [Prochilodus magdalenae]